MWCTKEQVTTLTGVTVDDATRALAAQAIELKTGLIEEVVRSGITDRDKYWLKLAVAYQAAWLTEQPDYLTRNDVTMASQDGQSAQGANRDWLVLGAMARTAIKRLSWRGTRTIAIADQPRRVVNVNDDEYEDTLGWTPV